MTHKISLPHRSLHVWHLAVEYVTLIHSIKITSAEDRAQARSSARSCARNIAEGGGRRSLADKSRVYAIALGECSESVACVELAAAQGACSVADCERAVQLGGRICAMLSRLVK
jgi:four helix bundle protein